jgi:Uma2 family endonuclease
MVTNISTNSNAAKLPVVMVNELIWRLSLEQYHKMIRAGILTENDPVEFLEGWLIHKMPKNSPHSISTKLARQSLERALPAGWYVETQEPITLQDSEPEPDVVVIRGSIRDYIDRHPSAQEVAFVVEVASSTLERDRRMKRRIYARAGIPVYWLVNLVENCVEVYTAPSGESVEADYQQFQVCRLTDRVPVMIEGQEITQLSVRDLLP